MHVYVRRRALEIIDIRRSDSAYVTRVTRDQMGELRIDLECGGGCRGDPGDLVDRVRQPLHLCLPAAVHAPDGVRQRLRTRIHFGRQRTLAQVHDRSAYYQVFVEFVF